MCLMADNFISNDINKVLKILPYNYANKSWILSKLNETFTLTIKWNLAPATTPSTGRIGHGILTPPQSATASTPCSFQANARHTPAQPVTWKKYKSPSTRRRDRARLLAWKKRKQNTPEPSARRSLFQQDPSACDNHISDLHNGPVSESLEPDLVPDPVATVTLDSDGLIPFQVAEDTGNVGSVDSIESDSEPGTVNPATELPAEPVAQGESPQVPFPFTWSKGGFLPGGVLPRNVREEDLEEYRQAVEPLKDEGLKVGEDCYIETLLDQVDGPFEHDLERAEVIKRALLSRNQYFLGRCFANNCDNLVDNKSVCKKCNIARYCSQECAVFDLAHRTPHPVYPEVNTCEAIEEFECYVVDPTIWNEFGLFCTLDTDI